MLSGMSDPKVDRLSRVPLFAGVSTRELEFVASRVDEVSLKPGQTLISEGQPTEAFFAFIAGGVVLVGQAEVYAAMHRKGYQPATALGLVLGGMTLAAGYLKGEQAMLFLNRRGYAPLVLCRACGEKMKSPDTDSWLVEHRYSGRLVCHLTGFSMPKPKACPHCGAADSLVSIGPGVERVEEEARQLLRPGKYPEPFALRALGIVRGDEALIAQADERFRALRLHWHADQTESLRRFHSLAAG